MAGPTPATLALFSCDGFSGFPFQPTPKRGTLTRAPPKRAVTQKHVPIFYLDKWNQRLKAA